MNILFNKDDEGSRELVERLGFIDKSVKYDKMERFVRSASREVYELIGKDTYDTIYDYYTGDPSEEQEVYIKAIQDAVAIQAYRQYAPSNDVGHTTNGRKMRLDDHEKMPFEWLIDKDNENMERMYYKSLDDLLLALDALASWKATDEYKSLNELFVSTTKQFQEFFDIGNSRLLLLKLQPGLRQCERLQILPRLGKEGFDALKADHENQEELYKTVCEACVYWSLQWAFSGRLTVTLFPEGVLQRYVGERNTTQGKQPATMNEYAWAAQKFKDDAMDLFGLIEDMVSPEVVEEDGGVDDDDELGFCTSDVFVTT